MIRFSRLFSLLAVLLLMSGAAYAGTLTLSLSQAQSFTLSSSNGLDFEDVDPAANGATFVADFNDGTGRFATFSTAPLSLAFTSADTFELFVFNRNDSTWRFTVEIVTTLGNQSVTIDLAQDVGATFAFDLNALFGGASGTITDVNLTVEPADGSGTIPIPGSSPDDRTAEFAVTVPEPGSLLLLALGLTGVAFRNRFSKLFS